MTSTTTLSTVASKIASVTNRGNLNWSGSNTTYGVSAGYYTGGTLDSRPSYNNGYSAGVTAADNRANANSTNYKAGYSAGVAAGKALFTYKTGSFTTPAKNQSSDINLGFNPVIVIGMSTDHCYGFCRIGYNYNFGLKIGDNSSAHTPFTALGNGFRFTSGYGDSGKTMSYVAIKWG